MRVEITHEVDWLPDGNYNFLVYDFITSDSRVRARTYTDEIRQVAILGRMNVDGTSPFPTVASPFQGTDLSDADPAALLAAMDATKAAEFDSVLKYLRERFDEVRILGADGYKAFATGLSDEEIAERLGETVTINTSVDLRRPGAPK